MEYFIIALVAFLSSILTFFSGFGLGTLLAPVFMLFFPVDLAIALTGLVHFFNNIFKLILVGRHADKNVLLKFGIPAILAAMLGAWLLLHIEGFAPLYSYNLMNKNFEVPPLNFVIAILLFLFAMMDLIPKLKNLRFDNKYLSLGGLLSGFFGGLSGHQGALRSAFLIKAGLSKEAFVGTAVLVSCFVDFTRLSIYASHFTSTDLGSKISLIIIATSAAVVGAYIGNKLLKKLTLKWIQRFVAVMLIAISIALGAGWI